MTTPPTLSDGVVTIRPFLESDLPGVVEQCRDPQTLRWTQTPDDYTEAMARDFCLERAPRVWAEGSEWIFAIENDLGDREVYAGNIALRPEAPGVAEIAYAAHPAARGTGAVDRALRLLLAWGFERQDLETVVWRASVGNWASRKAAWRLGFSLDGVLRHSHEHRGGLDDAWVGTLLRDEPREPRHAWLRAPELRGDGVALRPVRPSDDPRVVEACADARTARWLGRMPVPYTLEDAARWREDTIEKQATGDGTTWAVVDPATDVLLGALSLFDHLEQVAGELGWWMHPDARGRGVMSAAVAAALPYLFGALGLRVVTAAAALDNTASRRVMEANGMREIGVESLGTTVRPAGPAGPAERADLVGYELLASEWTAAALAGS